MKKTVLFFLMIILIASCHQEEIPSVSDKPEGNQLIFDLSDEDALQGCIYVKLKEEPTEEVQIRSIGNTVRTGIKVLDRAASSLKIERMERTFPYAGKFEERTRKEGLHLWYNVWFSKDTSATRAAAEVAFLDGIEMAVPVPKIVSRARPETVWDMYGIRVGEWLFNDPDLSKQWYFDNPGTESWQREGADIRLVDVWKQYNGIAGGNGTPGSGVKLMSCQILKSLTSTGGEVASDPFIAAAIKYGADNGAVISQNSWGYAVGTGRNTSSYINPVHKEAIDYFIKYAGCDNNGEQLDGSPMKGGIVLFASGNANTSDPRIAAPADYDKVVAVAAIEADYRKASYSNYGTYMDISAPGGALNGDGRIWSTTTKLAGNYEYLAGTSMACPLVSGVAALVIEKYGVGKKGFTPETLKEILYQSAYDLDEYNPRYTGQLGHGCVDATAALKIDVSNLHPFTLKSNQVTDNTLIFSVSSSMAGNGELTLYNGIGNKVLSLHLELEAASLHSVDITKLSAGYYTLVYRANGMEIREKFIKY